MKSFFKITREKDYFGEWLKFYLFGKVLYEKCLEEYSNIILNNK